MHELPATSNGVLPGFAEPSLRGSKRDTNLSAGRRMTLRQAEDIAAGRHPLTGGPFHPLASPETAAPVVGRPTPVPFTCGTCRFRTLLEYNGRRWPKCLLFLAAESGDQVAVNIYRVRNVTKGPATDVRAWWPACEGYEAGDQRLSRDASRQIAPPGS